MSVAMVGDYGRKQGMVGVLLARDRCSREQAILGVKRGGKKDAKEV